MAMLKLMARASKTTPTDYCDYCDCNRYSCARMLLMCEFVKLPVSGTVSSIRP